MKRVIYLCRMLLVFVLVWPVLNAQTAVRLADDPGIKEQSAVLSAEAKPLFSYPTDPLFDISWSAGTNGVADIQSAFNNARAAENSQLGKSIPPMTLPSQAVWNSMTDAEKAFWLINRERIDRGVTPLDSVEPNVNGVAQYYADYLLTNNAWGHSEDGRSPWERLEDNPAIGACHDFLPIGENIAVFVTSGTNISLPVERAVFMWLYDDGDCCNWGHRHAILWYPYNDNSGSTGQEGFLGIGRANGGPYQGPFSQPWNFAELIVMNVFDPCSGWDYTPTTFTDVSSMHPYAEDIEILYANGFTAGCSTSPLMFCPDVIMDRAQAAVFMLRGNFGSGYLPITPTHLFLDNWSNALWAEGWAESMFLEGLTGGCSTSPLLFCPNERLTNTQAAVFALRLRYGMNYTPPVATGAVFADLSDVNFWGTMWAERAYAEGIIPACGMSGGKPLFCPNNLVSRGFGAYIIVRARNLSMP